jgi:GTP-binding protein
MDEGDEIVVADIPGLIEGAAEGRGLGHRFLRHVERARALAVLLDLAPTAPHPPEEQERILLHELGEYRPELLERPRIVVGSKSDIAGADQLQAWEGPTFSAVTGDGIPQLVGAMADAVREARAAEPAPEPFVVHRPRPEGLVVRRTDAAGWVVEGRAVERAVALSDITNLEALAYVQQRLRSLGVDKALARAGARDGDPVQIGDFHFDYLAD